MDALSYELACLIGHEALHEGEISPPPDGWEYGDAEDDRGLPVLLIANDFARARVLEGICW